MRLLACPGETDRQYHHRPRPHGRLLLFSSLITRHSALFTTSSPSPISSTTSSKHPTKNKFLAVAVSIRLFPVIALIFHAAGVSERGDIIFGCFAKNLIRVHPRPSVVPLQYFRECRSVADTSLGNPRNLQA
jgi:hypothetical protein